MSGFLCLFCGIRQENNQPKYKVHVSWQHPKGGGWHGMGNYMNYSCCESCINKCGLLDEPHNAKIDVVKAKKVI